MGRTAPDAGGELLPDGLAGASSEAAQHLPLSGLVGRTVRTPAAGVLRSAPVALVAEDEPTYTVAQVYERLGEAARQAFPRSLWVRGEVRQHTTSRAGHHYLDLADPDRPKEALLKVVCFKSEWERIRAPLDEVGREVAEGMVLRLRGRVELYAPASQVSLRLEQIDVEDLLGRLALERARLVRALAAEGLLEANKTRPFPAVPLRIGLVASPGTEGYRDFVGQLEASGFAFFVVVWPSSVQGVAAPEELARAVRGLDTWDPGDGKPGIDVVVIVRGGGSRGDLAAFDAEPVARAVAGARHPVLVGIGHTGDQSVVDLVAHSSHPTPTACAKALVDKVRAFGAEVAEAASAVGGLAQERVESAEAGLAASARSAEAARRCLLAHESARRETAERLARLARPMIDQARYALEGRTKDLVLHTERHLAYPAGRLAALADRLAAGAERAEASAATGLAQHARALARAARRHTETSAARLAERERLLVAYDYRRQLARGFAILRDPSGRVLARAAALRPGDRFVAELADGTVGALAEHVQASTPGGAIGTRSAAPENPERGRADEP